VRNVSLEEGIGRMAAWAKAVGKREPSRFEEIEVERGMYSFWKEEVARAKR
jgi:UDP-glucose 4-epimerase